MHRSAANTVLAPRANNVERGIVEVPAIIGKGLTSAQSVFSQTLSRFRPPQASSKLPVQPMLQPVFGVAACLNSLPQWHLFPPTIPKYLYGALGVYFVGMVQKLSSSSARVFPRFRVDIGGGLTYDRPVGLGIYHRNMTDRRVAVVRLYPCKCPRNSRHTRHHMGQLLEWGPISPSQQRLLGSSVERFSMLKARFYSKGKHTQKTGCGIRRMLWVSCGS